MHWRKSQMSLTGSFSRTFMAERHSVRMLVSHLNSLQFSSLRAPMDCLLSQCVSVSSINVFRSLCTTSTISISNPSSIHVAPTHDISAPSSTHDSAFSPLKVPPVVDFDRFQHSRVSRTITIGDHIVVQSHATSRSCSVSLRHRRVS